MNTHTVYRPKYFPRNGRTIQETIDAASDELDKMFADGWEIENEVSVSPNGIQYLLSREVGIPAGS